MLTDFIGAKTALGHHSSGLSIRDIDYVSNSQHKPRMYVSRLQCLSMRDSKLSRRTFLQAAAVTGAAATAFPCLPANAEGAKPKAAEWPENGALIPDEGWRLWPDTQAHWESDDIFLPEDVAWINGALCANGQPLPINPPTGGWDALSADAGKEVVLPTSVEQHFWGKFGAGADGKPRPYTPEEYRYAAPAAPAANGNQPAAPPADDNVPQNGAYFGVSWWYRHIDIPASMRDKRIFLHVRGAHLRAEVYLNGRLCGYSIMEELPFEADLTHAANPGGENLLAIRLTNPFGRFDWVDGLNAKWGKVALFRSHGFGALDRGMSISAHDGPFRVTDLYALNTPDPHMLLACFEVEQISLTSMPTDIEMRIIDPATGAVIGENGNFISPMKLGERTSGAFPMTCDSATLWTLDGPKLYHLRIHFGKTRRTATGAVAGDSETQPKPSDIARTVVCAFRTFTAEGITHVGEKSNAMFRLNGRRIRLYSSISWGFWGLNGMFPVPELAEKEVVAAKTLGLNCLNFHRNLAKEDVLRKHDEVGVLRYMEPGGGKLAIGRLPANVQANAAGIVMEQPTSEADKFAQRFMFVKCVEMVKAFRSHPSVIIYSLQNELGADLKNPATLAVLEAMHKEDPSRIVELNDGFEQRGAAQAWYAPWFDTLNTGPLHRSDEHKYADWWNDHQGAGDQWYDVFYQSPTKFTYKAPYKEILTEYGEMEGCARPDNHSLMVHQITDTYKKYGGVSYDLADHNEIIAGYDQFLDKWGFHKAFPTAESVFLAVGKTCYESWMNYMENARISDELDFAVISGWESTAIENHSGIVDNLRNFKSDPKLIAGSLLPVRPIAKQRAMCVAQGQAATFDLYLANDTSRPATGALTFTMITPSGKRQDLLTLPAPAQTPDQFSYLLREAFTTPPLREDGLYRFRFSISSAPLATQTKELWVTATTLEQFRASKVAVSGITPALRKQLQELGTVSFHDFQPGEHYDLIISSGVTAHTGADAQAGETTGESMPVLKPGHVPEPGETPTTNQLGHLTPGILDAVRAGTPLLAIPQANTLSEGVAKELAEAGAFTYHGVVGDFRAPWMGNWYFVREHPLFAGMPVNQAMGLFYQAKGRQSNGLLVEGSGLEVLVGYSRDHDRRVGAGTFTGRLGQGKFVFHRCPDFHAVLQQRFLANAIRWLTSR